MAENENTKPEVKMGRPRKIINQVEFEKLCGLHCTQQDICGWYGICPETLNRWCKETYQDEFGKPMTFLETYKVYSADGNISLRRYQHEMAKKSAAMAIFLGKVVLGQREDAEPERANNAAGPPLIINYNYGESQKPKEKGEPGADV